MIGYVYMTTNLVNNKRYIGQHISKEFTESYKGSGKLLKKAFSKYGFDNFKVELIEWCETSEDLDKREKYWIAFYNAVESKEFYNLAVGGGTGWSYINANLDKITRNYVFSEEHKKHLSESRKRSGKSKGEKNPNYGKRGENSVLHNRVGIYKGTINKYVTKEDVQFYLNDGWNLGRSANIGKNIAKSKVGRTYDMPQYQKDAISKALKGKPKSEDHKAKIRLMNVGRKQSQEQIDNRVRYIVGRKWINNGIENKFIYPKDLDEYLSNGWVLGMCSKGKIYEN